MSLRLRVAKLYQHFDREGAWPLQPNSGDGATRAATAFAALLVLFLLFCAAMCE